MIALLALIAPIYILITGLMGCQFIKWRYCRYIVSIILVVAIVLSSAVFAIDLFLYLNGGVKTTQYAAISKTKLTENLYYFSIDNGYLRIGPDIKKYIIITIKNSKNTEIKFLEMDIFSEENEFIIHYLPISKYCIKIKML